jgi:uncharacterized membrane protein YqgA involved in biofilm formation
MLSIAHSAKRALINVVIFVASIIFTTILCPVLANALNIEPLNDCANGISQGPAKTTIAQVYTFRYQQTGNDLGSTEALQNACVTAVANDFLDDVQSDIIAPDLSTGVLLSGVGVTGSSGAVSDASANDSPDRVLEPPSLTLMCIGLVAGLGIHLQKTTSRSIPFSPAL